MKRLWFFAVLMGLLWAGGRMDGFDLAEANNGFALKIYPQLCKEKGNVFFSPFSIYNALAMTYEGAREKTEREMAAALNLSVPRERVRNAFFRLLNELLPQGKAPYQLKIANAFWAEKSYSFREDFLRILKKYYKSSLFEADFKNNPEGERKRINLWVEEKTEGKIKELIPPGLLDNTSRLVLTNAIYFRGKWRSGFSKNSTQSAPFYSPSGKVMVPMMYQKGNFPYMEVKGKFQVLELPYRGEDLSMVIFLPSRKMEIKKLEASLSIKNLKRWLADMTPTEVEVYMPRFKMDEKYSLEKSLKALGMVTAFSREANFSGMTERREIFISQVLHRAYVEVNEEGTEAAGATEVGMRVTAAVPMPTAAVFRADHPFFFLIIHRPTGLILFMGKLKSPE